MIVIPPSRPKIKRQRKESPHVVQTTTPSVTVTPVNTQVLYPSDQVLPAFYVSPSGSDSNPGTEASPFETLEAARDAMRGSGTISRTYLRGGTYNVTSGLSLNSNDNSTIWIAYPTETPIIDLGDAVIQAFALSGASGVQFNGITFQNQTGSDTNGNHSVIQIRNSSTNVYVENCTFSNVYNAINVRSDGIRVLTNAFDTIDGYGIFADTADNGYYAGNDCTNLVGSSASFNWLFGRRFNSNTIEYNYINGCSGAAIRISSENNIDNTDNTIRYNVCYSCLNNGSDNAAIYQLGRTGNLLNTTIDSNWVEGVGEKTLGTGTDVTGLGIYCDDGCSGVTIQNNVVVDTTFAAFEIHSGRDITISNNIILLVADQDNCGSPVGGGSQPIHQYSLFYKFTASWPPAGGSMINNVLEQNIIQSIAAPASAPGAGGWTAAAYDADKNDETYFDHIETATRTGGYSEPTARNNVLYSNMDLSVTSSTDRGDYSNFGAGPETSSSQSDPLFNDLSSRDLTLDGGSPAYTEGFVDIAGVTDGGTFAWGSPNFNANSGYDRGDY